MKCTSPRVIVRTDVEVPKDVYKHKYDFDYLQLHPEFFMLVPCGHCRACRKAKAREWTIRLLYESNCWVDSCFLTLQYDPEHIPYMAERPDNVLLHEYYGTLYQASYNFGSTLVRSAVPDYIKRLREKFFRDHGYRLQIAYYYCGEYGSQEGRPHYHMILFGLGLEDKELLEDSWSFGHVTIGQVEVRSIQYVAGYVQKKLNGSLGSDVYGARVPPFGRGSPGLGLEYFVEHKKKFYQDKCAHLDGHKVAVPRYFFKKDENFHDLVMEQQDSPPLLDLVNNPVEFWEDVKQRTVSSVRRVQTHTKYSM